MRSTPCVILAGGGSRRFGTPKGLALLNGRPLIARVQDRLKAQTDGPIAVNTGSPNIYVDAIDLIVEDQLTGGLGPLAGVHAAMA
ncbi:MAG: NTP transferase domain-containing protein, partial [Pseudomonadota bacterium]